MGYGDQYSTTRLEEEVGSHNPFIKDNFEVSVESFKMGQRFSSPITLSSVDTLLEVIIFIHPPIQEIEGGKLPVGFVIVQNPHLDIIYAHSTKASDYSGDARYALQHLLQRYLVCPLNLKPF
jgi:hypothetical protein